MAESGSGAVSRRLRWSVVRAVLDPAVGHEQAGPRPVLVISNEDFNRLAGLATIVPLTTARRRPRSWEVLIPAGSVGLRNDSIALVPHVRTVSHDRFRPPTYGRLVDPTLRLTIARLVVEHFDFDDLEAVLRER